jgi:hypothetical protein
MGNGTGLELDSVVIAAALRSASAEAAFAASVPAGAVPEADDAAGGLAPLPLFWADTDSINADAVTAAAVATRKNRRRKFFIPILLPLKGRFQKADHFADPGSNPKNGPYSWELTKFRFPSTFHTDRAPLLCLQVTRKF